MREKTNRRKLNLKAVVGCMLAYVMLIIGTVERVQANDLLTEDEGDMMVYSNGATEENGIFIGNSNIVDDDSTTYWIVDKDHTGITASGADENNYNVKFDPQEGKLTLRNLILNTSICRQIKAPNDGYEEEASLYRVYAAFELRRDVELELIGENEIYFQLPDGEELGEDYVGFCAWQDLNVSGTGALTVATNVETYGRAIGIYIRRDLAVTSGKIGGKGIYNGVVTTGNITVKGGAVLCAEANAPKGVGCNVYGLTMGGNDRIYSLTVEENAEVSVIAKAESAAYDGVQICGTSHGIAAANVVLNTKGRLEVYGFSSDDTSCGVEAAELNITGGETVIAGTGRSIDIWNYGAYQGKGQIAIYTDADASTDYAGSNPQKLAAGVYTKDDIKNYKYLRVADTVRTYNVQFETNSGTSVEKQIVKEGDKVAKPADPTKKNYKFGGWYSDSKFTTKYAFEAPLTSELTLYAKWDVIETDGVISEITIKVPGCDRILTLHNVASQYVIGEDSPTPGCPEYRFAFPGENGFVTIPNDTYCSEWLVATDAGGSYTLNGGGSLCYSADWIREETEGTIEKDLDSVKIISLKNGITPSSWDGTWNNGDIALKVGFYFGYPATDGWNTFPEDLISFHWVNPNPKGAAAGSPNHTEPYTLTKYNVVDLEYTGDSEKTDEKLQCVVNQKLDVSDKFEKAYGKYGIECLPNGTATVTAKGLVTGKKAGTATVFGYVKSGNKWVADKENALMVYIEKPAVANKTITLTKSDQVLAGVENLTGSRISPDQWTSSQPKFATIDSSTGTITAISNGTTKITAFYGEGKNAAKYSFNVKVLMPVISKKSATMLTGQVIKLTLKNTKLPVSWKSSNDSLATVEDGKVTAFATGDVLITATVDGVDYSSVITIAPPSIKKSTLTIKTGKTASVGLKNTKLKDIVWSSSDESVVTVDNKGKVKGIAPGTASVSTMTGGVLSECIVTVK